MSYLHLSKRATSGKLLRFANFKDGSFVNLIRLDRPYKNGLSFSVYETTKSPFCSNGIFKDEKQAIEKFELMVKNAQSVSELREAGDNTAPGPEAVKSLTLNLCHEAV